MDKLLEQILEYGLIPAFLLILLFLIVQNPNRAFTLKAFLVTPLFKLFHWFKREYIANEVARHLNAFFTKNSILSSSKIEPQFKIMWVKTDTDPILKGGKLVIRMRKDEDQTKNILTATKYALPKVVCPLFRDNILPTYSTAIDLTYLHKLADQLGNHGKAIFKKHFLNPELENDPTLIEIFQKLIRIDKYGIFTTIFINELDYVGEGLYADSDTRDKTKELIQFLNYLSAIAEREIGEDIGEKLTNFSENFKVSVILLAKSQTANKKGLIPYLRRLNINLEKGSDSIYIIAFPPAFKFLDKFIEVVDGNQRVSIENVYKTKEPYHIDPRSCNVNLCCLRRNRLFTNESFVRKIEANDVKIGKVVQGTVIDCSSEEALISFLGMDGTIKSSECSWFGSVKCTDILNYGDVKKFIIKTIDKSNGGVSLTLKFPEDDPWKKVIIPKVDEEIEVFIISKDKSFYRCVYKDLLEIFMPVFEISWFLLTEEEKIGFLKKKIKVKVTKVDMDSKVIECSHRQLESDPWKQIHASLTPGTEFSGRVHEVTEHYVKVKIGNGYDGRISRDSLLKAGFEYSNYQENLVVGQGLDVIVTKVFINKKWIRLDLKRNQN